MTRFSTFPVSLKVEGRTVAIVGGGEEAANKARLLAKTHARVIVFADHVEPDVCALAHRVETRALGDGDADDLAAIFVATDDTDAFDHAVAFARFHRIPLNVVDEPDLCDFYVPAIVDRAPLAIAISTEGHAPVLARLVRARIEALLAPDLGKLAALAGSLRHQVMTLLKAGRLRRIFFERLIGSQRVSEALSQSDAEGRREALRLLNAVAAQSSEAGRISVISDAAGAVDLLVLKAQRMLQEADVIVFDPQISEVVIQMGRRDATRIETAGRAGSDANVSQLRELARGGLRVVQMVTGNAGDAFPASVAKQFDVEFEVVPGVDVRNVAEKMEQVA